ncbi:MAG: hypothetical protein Q9218_000994 [Villophora microphyllina]
MLQQASSTYEQGHHEPLQHSIDVGRQLRRPSISNFRPRSSPLKFFASTPTSKPEDQRETQRAWEKDYLNDLRSNRPIRPSGARPAPNTSQASSPYPLDTALSISSAVSSRPLLPARQTSPSRVSRQERCFSPQPSRQEPSPTSSEASALPDQSRVHGVMPSTTTKSQPSEQAPPATASSRSMSSNTRTSSGLYRERAQRLAEKEEARMLREALKAVDLQEEARLHSAAQGEASELVWQHQNPSVSQKSVEAPYRYEQRSWSPSHVRSQSDQPLRTSVKSTKGLIWAERPASKHSDRVDSDTIATTSSPADRHKRALPCQSQSDEALKHTAAQDASTKVEEHSNGRQNENTRGHESWDSPHKKAYMNLTFSIPQLKSYGRRRSSGTKARTPSGSLFRNPDDKIYEEPEALKHLVITQKVVQDMESTPLSSTTRNTVARMHTASHQCLRSMTDPIESKDRHSRTEIHRNAPSQSRNPTYLQNRLPPTPLEEVVDDEPDSSKPGTKHGVEVRSDEIRAATSMRLGDRSAKLPSPTVVSNAKGRPIVSFDKGWTPSKGDFKRQEILSQHPADQGVRPRLSATARSKPLLPQSTASAPIIPTINAPEPPTIQVDEAPPIPSINVSPVPCISVSIADTTDRSSCDAAKPSRPLPTPSGKSVPRPSGRPLPHHSSTAPVRTSFPHWSPSQRRATAQCAACALPISGRIVSAATQRFHPECFTCFHCSEQLECVAFYPEPDSSREERVARIRARSKDVEIADAAGKTWEDDGDEGLRFYCHLDFHEKFSPRCRSCKTPIEGEVVVACGGEWHDIFASLACPQIKSPQIKATLDNNVSQY